mmetsp:Transcript_39766/g.98424  ORF Transcript_39766/g.98424 Transcript_39766/m.98424 type:complete len:246 (-) Transcript_39766:233-970(-)
MSRVLPKYTSPPTCAPPLTYRAPAPDSFPSAVSNTFKAPLMAADRSTARPPARRTDASTASVVETVASVVSATRTVPVMNVFMPTVTPPVVTSDARAPHAPYVDVPQLSVASCAFTGYATLTFSAPSRVSKVMMGLPASAVTASPAASLSLASTSMCTTCSGACTSRRSVSELTTQYLFSAESFTVSAVGLLSCTTSSDSPLRLLKMTLPCSSEVPSTSRRCAGADVSLYLLMSPTATLPEGPCT